MTDEEFDRLVEQARAEARRTSFPALDSEDPDERYGFHTQHAEYGAPAH
ncbi:hypothetical protein AB0P12_16800 [Streptomyces subrutilus]|uniref:Uncharacterized protein n=1 Tax=Streptomyces subrutilus TaxID=36818 RepID=A0A918V3R9_9ACTN|nr:hypothetical protein [Streptomyces subrutilus]WSJ33301.1 hypothetical protein OG479_30595 [Streptomyces subrutilus]GGZ64577.1 hypothetical protein GCM10010371_25270 [Streptomyces subrutilus]